MNEETQAAVADGGEARDSSGDDGSGLATPLPGWQMLRWGTAGVMLLVMALPVVTFHGSDEADFGGFGSIGYKYEDRARVWGYTESEGGFTCWCERPATGYWFGLFLLIGSLVMSGGLVVLALNRFTSSAILLWRVAITMAAT